MYLINIDGWMGPPEYKEPGKTYMEPVTFKELYFTFMPLATALMLIKEQEELYKLHFKNQGHTWTVTGVNEIIVQETAFATYTTQVSSIRENLSGLNAIEVTPSFNVDWLERNVNERR